jgi:hypothetical protein
MIGPILVPVSAGELIDKITILEIKAALFNDANKLAHVRLELAMLAEARDRLLPASSELAELASQLRTLNEELWRVEDSLRLCEQRSDFDTEFVELARSVYRHNDRRSALKRSINELAGSALVEEKSYTPYD